MELKLTVEQVYQLRELIYEEMDRVGGILNLSTELTQIAKKLAE
jgi:hypothetical protein